MLIYIVALLLIAAIATSLVWSSRITFDEDRQHKINKQIKNKWRS